MDPIITPAIVAIVTQLGAQAFSKAFDTTTEEFTKGSVNWLKSKLFNKDEPKEALAKYQEKPDSEARKKAVIAMLEAELEDDPSAEKWIKELKDGIEKQQGITITAFSNNQVDTGGGASIIGNNNLVGNGE